MRTIARELGLRLTATVVVVVALVSGLSFWYSMDTARRKIARRAASAADEFSEIAAYHLWNVDRAGLEHASRVVLQSPLVVGVQVHDETGERLVDLTQPGGVFVTERRPAVYRDPLTGKRHTVGTVDLSLGDWVLRDRERTLVQTTLALALAVLFAVLLATRLLIERFLGRPLARLRLGIRRIAEGDYRSRLAPGRGAEIDSIVQDVHAMAERIASREEELRRSHQQLLRAQRLETVGRLAGGVAHDFNNILLVILGMTDLMRRERGLDSRTKQRLDSIRHAAERAANLTRQLLTFSRQEEVQPRELDLGRTLAGLEDMLRRGLGEDIELVLEADPELWPVRADPTQIEQVAMNLAVNARDAMPEGGRLYFTAANRPELDQVELVVRDTGGGIAPELIEKIFDPFFTTKQTGQGTGLGLATVHGIVEAAGGSIEVESVQGQGTTFRIRLPRSAGAAAPVAPAPAVGPACGSETILLVEDDEAVRVVAREGLEAAGYRVIVACDGEDALDRLARTTQEIDLLVTDVVMPRMRGTELVARLWERGVRLPVLYVSGYAEGAPLERELARGRFLAKPFTGEELARKVREVLDHSAAPAR